MPRKVHNHDSKSAYRNDGERQKWRGGVGINLLEEAFRDNHLRMQTSLQLHRAKTKTTNILARELLFADDIHQRSVDALSNASSKFGLKINIKQTKVMFQPNSKRTMEEHTCKVYMQNSWKCTHTKKTLQKQYGILKVKKEHY